MSVIGRFPDIRSATRSNRFQNENAAWPWEKSSMHDHHPITRRWWRDVTPFGDPRSLEIGRIETVRVPIRGPSDFDPAISGPSRIAARFKNTCLKIRQNAAKWSFFFVFVYVIMRCGRLSISLPPACFSFSLFLFFLSFSLFFPFTCFPLLFLSPFASFSLWISCRRSIRSYSQRCSPIRSWTMGDR